MRQAAGKASEDLRMCLCPKPVEKHGLFYLNATEILKGWTLPPPLHFTEEETEAQGGRGGLPQVFLTAGKGRVRVPDTDGSNSLSSWPLCVLQRLAPSWHQACLFSAWRGEIRALPALLQVELHA